MSKDPLSPEQEEQVRRLLADARHTEPTPDHVVARLDAALADLAAEPSRTAAVVRLADRRRRAGRMLLAAAAVVVLGVGVGQVVGSDLGGGEDSPTAGSAEDAQEDAGGAAAEPEAEASGEDGSAADISALRRPYRISEQRFSREVEDLQTYAASLSSAYGEDSGAEAPGEVADEQDLASARNRLKRAAQRDVCEPGDWGRGGFVPVVYDASPGWLVLRAPQGDTQVADLFLCGSEQATRSVTLPFP